MSLIKYSECVDFGTMLIIAAQRVSNIDTDSIDESIVVEIDVASENTSIIIDGIESRTKLVSNLELEVLVESLQLLKEISSQFIEIVEPFIDIFGDLLVGKAVLALQSSSIVRFSLLVRLSDVHDPFQVIISYQVFIQNNQIFYGAKNMKDIRCYRRHGQVLHVMFSSLIFAVEIVSFDTIKLLMGNKFQKPLEL